MSPTADLSALLVSHGFYGVLQRITCFAGAATGH